MLFVGYPQTANVRSLACSSHFIFQGFSTIIFDRDFSPDLSFSLSFRLFIGIRRFKRLEFRLEALFLFNQLKQVFSTVKFDLSQD